MCRNCPLQNSLERRLRCPVCAQCNSAKLTASEILTLTGAVAEDLLGARIAADTGEWGTFAWTQHLLGAPGCRLAGGTDEVQHNIIGERVLGLPREPSVDKGIPFSEVARG